MYDANCFIGVNLLEIRSFLDYFCIRVDDHDLCHDAKMAPQQDVNGICTNGTRICRCMADYFIATKRYCETRSALTLSKCLKQRLWEDTQYQLKQLVGVGLVTAKVST